MFRDSNSWRGFCNNALTEEQCRAHAVQQKVKFQLGGPIYGPQYPHGCYKWEPLWVEGGYFWNDHGSSTVEKKDAKRVCAEAACPSLSEPADTKFGPGAGAEWGV